jgi:hypothetical protein
MIRAALEHIIRAASTIADDDEIIIIGSQAVLGQFPDAPADMLISNEADVYPKNHPDRADLIDGSIGEGSPFHDAFGYYAQGVGPETAVLPPDWDKRLIRLQNANTRGAAGLCLEIHDLCLAKLVAGREKDMRFTRAAARAGLTAREVLSARLDTMSLDERVRDLVRARIAADFAANEEEKGRQDPR